MAVQSKGSEDAFPANESLARDQQSRGGRVFTYSWRRPAQGVAVPGARMRSEGCPGDAPWTSPPTSRDAARVQLGGVQNRLESFPRVIVITRFVI